MPNGATGVPADTNIVVHVQDEDSGVDQATISMTVEGDPVTPVITGTSADYTLTHDPPTDFSYLQVVNVTVDTDDLAGNSMTTDAYSFTTETIIGAQISGTTYEANGSILGGVTITIDMGTFVVSAGDGTYQVIATTTGNLTITASKAGFM